MTYTDPYVEDWHDGKICGESWVMEHSPGNTEGVDLERDPSIHKRVCPRCGWASELYRQWRPR